MTAKAKPSKALLVMVKDPKDWRLIDDAYHGDEYAQARLADLLGWSGDDDQLAKVRTVAEDHAIVEIEIDGSVYARYKLK